MPEEKGRYSEAFKLRAIPEIESGELESIDQARRKYDIGSSRWQTC